MKSLNTIGIVSNNEKQVAISAAMETYEFLKSRSVEVLVLESDMICMKYGLPSVNKNIFEDRCDAVVSVGGDGTFLRASRYTFKRQIPVLGINAGKLGFLTEIKMRNIKESLGMVLNGRFSIEKRMLLDGRLYKDKKEIKNTGLSNLALNEFSITRSMMEKIVTMEIIVNGISIKSFSADGIIIATPTGSTAYSLSAGGPIVEPKIEAMIVTPICPHTLFSRSIIISTENELEIKILSDNDQDSLSVDGNSKPIYNLKEFVLKVKKSDKKLNLIRLNPDTFLKIFKEKFIDRI
ncbi:MAG: NAD(+)/NADH kinase [Actinobacteria bacterium]|nr:NAD(+)/NADH kinase [Actinomycetota bacterium]